ncbi:MAG: polyhydroxyalkanoate synthesis repressor PhaR [Alphaproteobacteria bacterium]|nr:polyhydroxyalkanoate synthesis repressor PhaR [Alphaproteobacteria bacterium]
MTKRRNGRDEPTVIKKYANRRLYDTGRSSYITLDDLCEMVQEGHDFVVYDAKSGEDLTRSVLTQIIVDQEAKGENLLPTGFLKNLIGFYGDNIQSIIPNYLEQTLEMFVKNQEQIREQFSKSFEDMGGNMPQMFPNMPSAADFEEMSRKNMEMFESAMKMFTPFNMGYGEGEQKEGGSKK